MWCWCAWKWCCKQWWIPLLIDLAKKKKKVTTVTKESGKAIDERPHYVQVTESATLSRGHFPDKPHLTERVFLFPLGARSPRANPNFFLLSGRLGELWRSGQRIWSEEGARGFDLLLALALSQRDSAVAWTEKGARRCGAASDTYDRSLTLTKGELCGGGKPQWDGLRGGGKESSVCTMSTLCWKPALLNLEFIWWGN